VRATFWPPAARHAPGIAFANRTVVPLVLSALVLALAAVGCDEDSSPTSPSRAIPVIVAFGDSLTSGPGLTQAQTYPALLQQKIASAGHDYRVMNAGVSGDTSSEALVRFSGALIHDTRILILAIGINDGLRGVPIATIERNISTMIEQAQTLGIKVLLCGMEAPPIGGLGYTIEFHRMFTRLADRYKVPLVPFFLIGILGNDRLDVDEGFHPNAAGHKVIAEAIWPYLRPML
jgi:acyl-CoA thioesterase-1